jgi:hypothetical protein
MQKDDTPGVEYSAIVGRGLRHCAFGLLTTMNPLGTAVSPWDAVETVTRDHPVLVNALICCSSCPGYRFCSTTLYSQAVRLV